MSIKAKPFVKWVGGKRSIINELLQFIPKEINNYYEPFVGGGALFFEIYDKVNYSYLSDLNVDLIVTYNVIKNNLNELIKRLKSYQDQHNKEYYYQVRTMQSLEEPIENSARFIYLMRTCYNGLYRVNKKNEFNTPMGKYENPIICDEENLIAVSETLIKADIKYKDFSKIIPNKGDFVYFDPPYYPVNNNSFVNYVFDGFNEKDQLRLRDFAMELSRNGINVMLSNSDSEFINNIYKKNFNINKVLYNPFTKENYLIIECKSQTSAGSTDEKVVYLNENIKQKYPYQTLVILDAPMFKKGAKLWFKEQEKHNSKLAVFLDFSEFRAWAIKNL